MAGTIECVVKEASGALKESGAVYVKPLTYTTIDANAFLAHVEQNYHLDRGTIQSVLYKVVRQMSAFLEIGHRVELPYLGTFSLKVNSEVEKDENDVVSLKDPHYGGIRFSPSNELKAELYDTKFTLLSNEARKSNELTEEQALVCARELCNEYGGFLVQEFRAKAHISISYARKLVKALEEQGKLTCTYRGNQRMYSITE